MCCFQFSESLQQEDKVIPGIIRCPGCTAKNQCVLRECLLIERVCHQEPWLLPYAALKEQALEQPQAQHSPLSPLLSSPSL